MLKGFLPALGVLGVLFGGAWVKSVFDQKKRNEVNEIDLSFKKIDLDAHTKPIDGLVSDSNKSHGASGMGQQSGDDDKKG